MTDDAPNNYLVVGLGNPGKRYEGTRHNLGFDVVNAFAAHNKMVFKRESKCKSELSKQTFAIGRVFVLKPQTFMNLSGEAVKLCVDYYRISLENLLVVVDDVYLDFGTFRLKAKGSDGGHNGLKNIEQHLSSREYPRLRIGVGSTQKGEDLATYVLKKFHAAEQKQISDVIVGAMNFIELWLTKGINIAMNRANTKNL